MTGKRQKYALPREDRIFHIAKLMRDGKWQRGASVHDLTTAWEMPRYQVESDAAEAATVLRVSRSLFDDAAREEVLRRFGEHLKTG